MQTPFPSHGVDKKALLDNARLLLQTMSLDRTIYFCQDDIDHTHFLILIRGREDAEVFAYPLEISGNHGVKDPDDAREIYELLSSKFSTKFYQSLKALERDLTWTNHML